VFTPLLQAAYSQINARGAKRFEVVYVSSDDTEAMMYKYMNDSHGDWLAIAYGDKMR
jgi:hypothetical protein